MSASTIIDAISPYDSDSDKALFIGYARARINTAYYGSNAEMAVALRACHMMAMRDQAVASGGGGEIASKREGDLSVSFHKSDTGSDDLGMSGYGRQLQGLTKGSGIAIAITGGNDDGS